MKTCVELTEKNNYENICGVNKKRATMKEQL